MLKRNLWKITLSFFVALWALFSLLPIADRPFEEHIVAKASARTDEFAALMQAASDRVQAGESPTVFIALRDLANERRIDLTDFFPQVRMEASLRNLERRNAILLDHILKDSKGRLQLGLDLRGGVAFTLQVDETALADAPEHVRDEKLSKAIEILGKRINGLGVVEPIIRPVGSSRIEVQLPGVNTRDNPEIVSEMRRPARLDFRRVHPTQRPGEVAETPIGYEVMTLVDDSGRDARFEEYFVRQVPDMTGEGVSDSFVSMDAFGRYEIIMRFTDEGRRRFAEITRLIVAENERSGRIGQLAIVLDGRLYSAPTVREVIDSPSAQISGSFTQREAADLANVLNNPLDLPLSIQEQFEVGPSLAADAIASGTKAFLLGLGLTAITIILMYSVGGFMAVIAMTFNVLIILGVMASLGATLTLPAIAGIVLTLGMSVDSNILIFERIREELRLGKSLRASVDAGFEKALSAIVDGNLTTLITAGIMIALGTGPVKGFGVTLAIGVFSTMFAALIVTRFLLDSAVDGGLMKRFRMIAVLQDTKYQFLRHAKPAFVASWLVVLIGVGTVVYKGNEIYGIDFTGGDQVTLNFTEKVDIGSLRAAANAAGVTDLNLTYSQQIGGDGETLRLVAPFDQASIVVAAIKAAHPEAGFVVEGELRIGPSIGKEIRNNAAWAIFWSLALILVYVAFRFEFGYGVGAIVATVHDILITIGLFVLLGGQFNASMVAAILLIAGYSINDTIVVFDRIREELALDQTSTLGDVINRALNLTLSRTIITGGTTLVTALVLFTLATGDVRDIALTLMIGVIVGTFSSLFIACPVFYWWHKGDRRHVEQTHDAKPTYEWTAASKASE